MHEVIFDNPVQLYSTDVPFPHGQTMRDVDTPILSFLKSAKSNQETKEQSQIHCPHCHHQNYHHLTFIFKKNLKEEVKKYHDYSCQKKLQHCHYGG